MPAQTSKSIGPGSKGKRTSRVIIIFLLIVIAILVFMLVPKRTHDVSPTEQERMEVTQPQIRTGEPTPASDDTQREEEPADESTTEQPSQENEPVEDLPESTESSIENVVNAFSNFTFIHPSGWIGTQRANELIGAIARGEKITIGIVEDPTVEHRVYFASQAFDQDGDYVNVSFFTYDSRTMDFERIRKNQYYFTSMNIPGLTQEILPVFHVLAIERRDANDPGKLIVLVQDANTPFNQCDQPLISNTQQGDKALVSLNLADPYAAFVSYQLPEDVRRVLVQTYGNCIGI